MIRVFNPQLSAADIGSVAEVMASGNYGPGPVCKRFEAMLAEYTGCKHVVLCNSGSTALLLALIQIRSLKHVVHCPAYGMHAGAEAAKMLGLPVSLYDLGDTPATHDGGIVLRINQNGLPGDACDIEDACQSLGIPGCFQSGCAATLSFSPAKLVTTGLGGAILVDDEWMAEGLRGIVDHGGDWRQTRIHQSIGGNFRMPDILAALGVSQMRRIDQIVAARDRVHGQYRALLPAVECGWCVTYRSDRALELIEHLRKADIEALQPYRPVHHHPPFACAGHFPNADRAARELVYLPGSNTLTEADVALVCSSIKEFEVR